MDEQDWVEGDAPIPAIVPHRERVVDFYGDPVPVAQAEGDKLYVPLRPLTRFLGISFGSQRDRILRDEVLKSKLRQVQMKGADGRERQQLCLPLEMVPGWLFGISTARVRPELKARLDLYRADCYDVLWSAFKADILPAVAPPSASGLSNAELTLEMITAMQHLATQQVEMERRVGSVEGKQEAMTTYVRDFIQDTHRRLHDSEQRLTSLEMRLDPASALTDAQAAEVALAVKNVGNALEQRGTSGGYAKVYSEMYRRYRVSSYKNLPRHKYDEVLRWLGRWYDEITTNPPAPKD